MGKMKCSVSCEDLKKLLDVERMLDVSFNGINVPYTCGVKDKKIGDLSNNILAKRRKELRKVDKCYIVYNSLDNVFFLYNIIGFNHRRSDEIYAGKIEATYGYCGYYDTIDITEDPIYNDVYCDYREISIDYYNELKCMIGVCNEEVSDIVRNNLNKSNLYDWDELDKYSRSYKSFCNNAKSRHYCSKELAEMSISEFNNKLSEYNELVNVTLDKMVKDLTDEFIVKHRYLLCDDGNHCYSVRRFDRFYEEEDYEYEKDYGYIKRCLDSDGERIYFVVPSDSNPTNCHINYSMFSSRFWTLNSSVMSRIYHLSDDSLGDKLFDDYKSIYNKVSEMYNTLSKMK